MKPILVGQAPSRSHGHAKAFDGPSGDRLAHCIGGDREALFRLFDTVNLLQTWPGKYGGAYAYREKGDRFSIRRARAAARKLRRSLENRVIVACGARVGHVLGCDGFWAWVLDDHSARIAIPHPSACNVLANWSSRETQKVVGAILGQALELASLRDG